MPKIFISYRRADSRKDAGRIYDRLVEAFGKENIFKDVDNIPFGRDFRAILGAAVNNSDVMLIVIGQQWLNSADEHGNRRLDNSADFVRIEVQAGLQRGDDGCLLIPVLVDGALMPVSNQLPPELQDLAFKNAVTVRDDPDFHRDMERLVRQLQQYNVEPNKSLSTQPTFVRFVKSPVGIVTAIVIVALMLFLLSKVIQNASNLPTPTTAALLITDTPQTTAAISSVIMTPTVEATAQPTNTIVPTDSSTPTEVPSKTLTPTPMNTGTSTASPTPKPPTATTTPSATLTPTPLPTDTAQPVILHNADWKHVEQDFNGVTMVQVPPGCFDMGNDLHAYDDNTGGVGNGGHICFDQSFWIDKTEITNAQFATFKGTATQASNWNDAERPRETITWFEARDFCLLRGGRLPTEAEWEYAARGPDNWLYPWGNEFNAANVVYSDNSNNQTAPVGSKPSGASWVGALDMSGNVWEWVSTLYAPYPYPTPGSAEERDQWIANANATDPRTLRGDSWRDFTGYLRAASRFGRDPNSSNYSIGFRCVVSAPNS